MHKDILMNKSSIDLEIKTIAYRSTFDSLALRAALWARFVIHRSVRFHNHHWFSCFASD
jgi:hypothetical protein